MGLLRRQPLQQPVTLLGQDIPWSALVGRFVPVLLPSVATVVRIHNISNSISQDFTTRRLCKK